MGFLFLIQLIIIEDMCFTQIVASFLKKGIVDMNEMQVHSQYADCSTLDKKFEEIQKSIIEKLTVNIKDFILENFQSFLSPKCDAQSDKT